ncbi:MAG: NAD(P)-dependent oxidoreductase [Candidatus Humimicrobiaceae bacterium]
MTMFPLFVDIKDKSCVVVGGGNIAARKIKTLIEFDAKITVAPSQFEAMFVSHAHDNGDLKKTISAIDAVLSNLN